MDVVLLVALVKEAVPFSVIVTHQLEGGLTVLVRLKNDSEWFGADSRVKGQVRPEGKECLRLCLTGRIECHGDTSRQNRQAAISETHQDFEASGFAVVRADPLDHRKRVIAVPLIGRAQVGASKRVVDRPVGNRWRRQSPVVVDVCDGVGVLKTYVNGKLCADVKLEPLKVDEKSGAMENRKGNESGRKKEPGQGKGDGKTRGNDAFAIDPHDFAMFLPRAKESEDAEDEAVASTFQDDVRGDPALALEKFAFSAVFSVFFSTSICASSVSIFCCRELSVSEVNLV